MINDVDSAASHCSLRRLSGRLVAAEGINLPDFGSLRALLDLQLRRRDAGSHDLRGCLLNRGLCQPTEELLQRLRNINGGFMCRFEAGAEAISCWGGENTSLTPRARMLGNCNGARRGFHMFGSWEAHFQRTFGALDHTKCSTAMEVASVISEPPSFDPLTQQADPFTLVIFGTTGDLRNRSLPVFFLQPDRPGLSITVAFRSSADCCGEGRVIPSYRHRGAGVGTWS